MLDPGPLPRIQARTEDVADWTTARPIPVSSSGGRPRLMAGGGRVVVAISLLLWNVLTEAYSRRQFDTAGDDVFRFLVFARIVEPTSKAHTIGVSGEIVSDAPSLRAVFRCALRRHRAP